MLLFDDIFTPDAKKHTSCHHELSKTEIWVANTNVLKGLQVPEHYAHLKTIRLGEQAYDIKGNPIERNYMRPLIVDKSDFLELEKIWSDRMNDFSKL